MGTTLRRVEEAISQARNLQANGNPVSALAQKRRADFVRERFNPHVYNFLLDDKYTRLDTNQGLLEVIDQKGAEVF